MKRLHKNRLSLTLAANINNSQTSFDVTDASGLGTLTGDEFIRITVSEGANIEEMDVTDVSTNTLTVIRETEGSTAASFTTAASVQVRTTADSHDRKQENISGLTITEKAAPVVADKILIQDSEDGNSFKYSEVSNLPFIGFKVRRTTAQTIPTITATKILLNSEDFDTEGDFDSVTNNRHQPTIAGKWFYVGFIAFGKIVDGGALVVSIYKNGTVFKSLSVRSGASGLAAQAISEEVPMNGSSDYVEFYVVHVNGADEDTLTTVQYQPTLYGEYKGP